jgi:hypothetical protein
MEYAPKKFLPYMPDPHREFYCSLPFLVVAARDRNNKMWCTFLFSSNGNVTDFVRSQDPTTLSIDSLPVTGDALEGSFKPGIDVGILGIDFDTRRRNKVNGRLREPKDPGHGSLEFKVDQSFAHCPKYIKARDWSTNVTLRANVAHRLRTVHAMHLSNDQMWKIEQADTMFVATGYRGAGEDPRFGNDVAHRGGLPGFIKVKSPHKLLFPEYEGNNHCNTVGNLEFDQSTGITIPLFDTGGMIQMTGVSSVHWDKKQAASLFPGAKQIIEFKVDQVVELSTNSFPICWPERNPTHILHLEVAQKVQESDRVVSIYFRRSQGKEDSKLPTFLPGQHLELILNLGEEKYISRYYSISNSPSEQDVYRISVKREDFGLGSRLLYDQVKIGDVVAMQKPAGGFFYNNFSRRPLVMISAGIGAAPLLSILHKFVEDLSLSPKKAYWIHSTDSAEHHSFKVEVESLQKTAKHRLISFISYTRAKESDSGHDSTDHITAELVERIVPELEDADIYLCGPTKFVTDLKYDLQHIDTGVGGVPLTQIYSEEF